MGSPVKPHVVYSAKERVRLVLRSFGWGLALGIALMWCTMHFAAPVRLLDPMIERAEADYSIYRVRFEWMGVETAPCHFVAWHQTGKWTARCG